MRSSASPPVIVSARPESTSSENWSEEGAAGVAVATITVAIMANAVSSRHHLEVIEALSLSPIVLSRNRSPHLFDIDVVGVPGGAARRGDGGGEGGLSAALLTVRRERRSGCAAGHDGM